MTQEKSTQARANLKALIAEDKDFLREIVREAMQQVLEAGETVVRIGSTSRAPDPPAPLPGECRR